MILFLIIFNVNTIDICSDVLTNSLTQVLHKLRHE
jgi:hypothetical protein